MTDIEWGRAIPVNGQRPAWLADDASISAQGSFSKEWYTPARFGVDVNWDHVSAIRLPADHFAYRALDAGFEPWGGGDAAPADWDGDRDGVLYRDGDSMGRGPYNWRHFESQSDIIGYRKKVEPTPVATRPADTVTIKRMTKGQAREYINMVVETDPRESLSLAVLRHLGIIKPDPTPVDLFLQAHPDADRATAEQFAAWSAKQ